MSVAVAVIYVGKALKNANKEKHLSKILRTQTGKAAKGVRDQGQ